MSEEQEIRFQWNINDIAYHSKYGSVEIFEISYPLGYANVSPIDEDKWGTAARIVSISELQKQKI